jgi:hypothetical protein
MLSRSTAAVAVAAFLSPGCSGDDEDRSVLTSPSMGAGTPGYVGAYTLVEVSGQPLPILQYIDAVGRTEFVGGRIALLTNDRWTVASYFRSTITSGVERTWTDTATGGGTYHPVGATLVLTETNAAAPVAIVTRSGTDITLAFTGAARTRWTYRRVAVDASVAATH